jgi:hypothetical protein
MLTQAVLGFAVWLTAVSILFLPADCPYARPAFAFLATPRPSPRLSAFALWSPLPMPFTSISCYPRHAPPSLPRSPPHCSHPDRPLSSSLSPNFSFSAHLPAPLTWTCLVAPSPLSIRRGLAFPSWRRRRRTPSGCQRCLRGACRQRAWICRGGLARARSLVLGRLRLIPGGRAALVAGWGEGRV